MSYGCLDLVGKAPALDVAETCAHDTGDGVRFLLHTVVAKVQSLNFAGAITTVVVIAISAMIFSRLAALLLTVVQIAWQAFRPGERVPSAREVLIKRQRERHAEVMAKRSQTVSGSVLRP